MNVYECFKLCKDLKWFLQLVLTPRIELQRVHHLFISPWKEYK